MSQFRLLENKSVLFLDLQGTIAKFVPNFATSVQPIHNLQTALTFEWNYAEADAAFKEMKYTVCDFKQYSFVSNRSFGCTYITTDAFWYGIGSRMIQVVEGQERLIACISR